MKTSPFLHRPKRQSGSATIAALTVITICLSVVGLALLRAAHRSRTAAHATTWMQAGQAAEAGVETTLATANKASWVADGWASAPATPAPAGATSTPAPISSPSNARYTYASSPAVTASVKVDQVTVSGSTKNWLRIRSTGIATIPGGEGGNITGLSGLDRRDNLLRKLTFKVDRMSGAAVPAAQARRFIEVLAEPSVNRPFQSLFTTREIFDVNTLLYTWSYDSSDPTKSDFLAGNTFGSTTYGTYAAAKKQPHGDVATVATGTWNINHAHINGNVLYPTGASASQTENVNGSLIGGYTFTFPDEVSPAWTTTTASYASVPSGGLTLAGSTSSASPSRYKVNAVSSGKLVHLTNPAGATESWVEVWVPGDFIASTSPNTGLLADKGVHTTLYFGGKVDAIGNTTSGGTAYGITNGSKLPSMMMIHYYGGTKSTLQTVNVSNIDFWAVCSGPYCYTHFDKGNIYGSFLSYHFDASDGTNLFYDEALKNFNMGASSGYAVRSWVEGVR